MVPSSAALQLVSFAQVRAKSIRHRCSYQQRAYNLIEMPFTLLYFSTNTSISYATSAVYV